MTERENEVLEIIKKNPLIGQAEIARELGITRSSAAVHIASLTKKGYIVGRGYVIAEGDCVVGVGAANVDVHGRSRNPIILRDSNPGHMNSSVGGVTRNILDNLSRLGVKTKLITAVGDDVYADKIRSDSFAAGIDVTNFLTVNGNPSSTYLSILDTNGDMAVALSDMSIMQNIMPEFLRSKSSVVQSAKVIVCDPSLPPDSMEYLLTVVAANKPVFVDPVSTSYARTIKHLIKHYHTIKPNKMELSELTDSPADTFAEVERASEILLDKGCKRVVVTLGEEGCYLADSDGVRMKKSLKPLQNMANATGAGDSFTAGLVYGFINGLGVESTLEIALACGIIAIMSESTINPRMSPELVERIIREHE